MKKAVHARFMTGAKKSPRHALLGAMPFVALAAPPAEFAVVPPKLDIWGNSTYGDCVSAEEAFAKAAYSVQCGLPELFATEAEVVNFAGRHNWLNGATLTEVMDVMASEGMPIGGKAYKDGGYAGVDYANEATLQAAIAVGPVKVAIDAGALPNDAGNRNGWWSTDSSIHPDTDHCVSLPGYGSATYLYGKLGLPVPAGLPGDTRGYLLFTWDSIGFVTHGWIKGTVTEAWVRTPTTVGQSPAPVVPPTPPVPPTPTPLPAVVIDPLTLSIPAPSIGDIIHGRAQAVTISLTGHLVAATVATGISPLALFADVRTLAADLASMDFSGDIAAVRKIADDLRAGNWSAVTPDALDLMERLASNDWPKLYGDVKAIAADVGISI